MHLRSWHIDGFGVFRDFSGPDLDDGLTVFLGPNEAGKTTLLAFIRGVLFGFRDKRSATIYEPVRGGRHGGRLVLAADGGTYVVAREAGRLRAKPVVTDADGTPAAAGVLSDLLGGADETLYSTVFAFGLDELQDLDSMTNDRVADRIFSASLVGAGQSAQQVLAELDARAGALYKKQGRSTVIGDLLKAHEAAEAALRQAQDASEGYPALLDALDHADAAVEELRAEAQRLRRERERAAALVDLWPTWRDLEEAHVAATPDGDPVDEIEMQALADGVPLQRQRLERLPDLRAEREAAAAQLASRLAELGDVDLDELQAIDASVAARDAAAGLAERLHESDRQLGEAASAATQADDEAERLRVACRRETAARGEQEPPAKAVTDELLAVATGLRADLQSPRGRPNAGRRLAVARLVLLALALALLGFGVWRIVAGDQLAGVAAVIFGLAVGGVGAALHPLSARSSAVPEGSPAGDSAARLGLPGEVSFVRLEAKVAELMQDRDRRAAWDAASVRLADVAADLEVAETKLAGRERALDNARVTAEALAAEWAAWKAAHGLPAGLSAAGVREFLLTLESAREARAQLARADRLLDREQAAIEEWERRARVLLAADDRVAGEQLLVRLDELSNRVAARREAEAKIRECESAITARLGTGPDAEALRAQMASGRIDDWRHEASAGEAKVSDFEKAVDEAIGRRRDAERALEALRSSADVAARDADRASVAAQLAEAVASWRLTRVARALMTRTLDQFVATHQPRLLEQASTLFAGVTDGRYPLLVQEGMQGGIIAVDRSGVRHTPGVLSRGTVEQLYLCLRLALVDEFARQNTSLPLVMDDVLVNFDPPRAAAVARVLADVATRHQVLLFTCHPETRDLVVAAAGPAVTVVELPLAGL